MRPFAVGLGDPYVHRDGCPDIAGLGEHAVTRLDAPTAGIVCAEGPLWKPCPRCEPDIPGIEPGLGQLISKYREHRNTT